MFRRGFRERIGRIDHSFPVEHASKRRHQLLDNRAPDRENDDITKRRSFGERTNRCPLSALRSANSSFALARATHDSKAML